MTPERMQQIEAIFHDACDLAPDERAAFLAQACADDADLRREVELLLASDKQATLMPAVQMAAPLLLEPQSISLVGQSISHYQILAPLGKGGMGEVYQARDTKLDRIVALKILPADVATDAERMRRFIHEARAASALNHPHVATIYEIGEANDIRFIAMEYVAGQTLAAKINSTPLAINELIAIGSQIADALDEAHGKGITHRDIKPANVMLNERGQVKVLDFGLAKITRATASDNQSSTLTNTEAGVVLGTVSYMSPEQALGRDVDYRSDLFSLGVVLYEMATGRLPFAGANTIETVDRILHAEPEEFTTDAPAALEQIVRKCLAKEREARYQSAAELLAELQTLPTARQAVKQTQSAPTARRMAVAGVRFAARRWLVVLTLAAVLLIGPGSFLYWRRAPAMQPEQIKTLAVLPPRPLHINGRDEALELGITSTLITRLSSLRQLTVRSDYAVAKYANLEQDPLAAGREQKVDAVLDSRYQRSGDKVRFTLRLLRVADGATIWADTLDQPTTDSFAIEDALSSKVTGALELTLNSAEKELITKRYTNSAEAWQLYVRGRQLVHTRQVPNIEKAITYLKRAIALDQGFALAHAMLGFAYSSLHYVGNSPADEIAPKAKAAYDKALKLDDQLAEAYTNLALYKLYYEWDRSGAEQLSRRALDLNPNSADVHHRYAMHLSYMGRSEQAIAEIRKAEDLDPTDEFILRNVAQVLYFARRYDEAIEQLQRAIDLNRNSPLFYEWLIRAYEMKGDEKAALAACLRVAEIREAGADEIARIKAAFAAEGLKGYWRIQLDRLLERNKSRYAGKDDIALLYARLGDKEQALAWLQRAVEERNIYVTALQVEPLWDSYRSDPRFVALVRRVGLTQ